MQFIRTLPALCLLLALGLLSGCATPVGVKPISSQALYRELNSSALSSGSPSIHSRQFLAAVRAGSRGHAA